MRPPNLRTEEPLSRDDIYPRSCLECIHARFYDGGKIACLKYLCFVFRNRICDSFEPGRPQAHFQDNKMIAVYWVDHDPFDDEKSLLDSMQLKFEE